MLISLSIIPAIGRKWFCMRKKLVSFNPFGFLKKSVKMSLKKICGFVKALWFARSKRQMKRLEL